jgi:hypothetical protein
VGNQFGKLERAYERGAKVSTLQFNIREEVLTHLFQNRGGRNIHRLDHGG